MLSVLLVLIQHIRRASARPCYFACFLWWGRRISRNGTSRLHRLYQPLTSRVPCHIAAMMNRVLLQTCWQRSQAHSRQTSSAWRHWHATNDPKKHIRCIKKSSRGSSIRVLPSCQVREVAAARLMSLTSRSTNTLYTASPSATRSL